MPQTEAEQKRTARAKKRNAGYVLKQMWVRPAWWKRIRELLAELEKTKETK